ncbi:MAG TPA: hypothetical protein VFQ91_12765 [Bryobacteraceae bacterium]|nr:hypothetical protein [Bryobacteraceae bacterium]
MKSFWNLIAIFGPLGVGGLAILYLATAQYGRGDWGGRMANGVLFLFGMAIVCALGAAAAVAALLRGEERMWLSFIALLGNLAVVLPVVRLLWRG